MNEAVSYQKEGGRGSHHVRESAKIKTKVPPKLRNHALKTMCRNKGAVTKTSCHIKLELGRVSDRK